MQDVLQKKGNGGKTVIAIGELQQEPSRPICPKCSVRTPILAKATE